MGQSASGLEKEGASPWEYSESSFLVEAEPERIGRILEEAREQHLFLTLVPENGRVFPQSLLIKLFDDGLLIDKPLEWADDLGPFRVFLRGGNGRWLFFRVASARTLPFSLSLARPAELFVLQRRSYPRVKVPQGTRAILKKDGKLLSSFYVRDISPAGMLVCSSSPASGIALDAVLNDIVISLPDNGNGRGRTLPPIDRGQVVRAFYEEESHIYCHGIAFKYESAYIRDALSGLAGAAG